MLGCVEVRCSMTKKDIQALGDAAAVAGAIQSDNMTLAKTLAQRINAACYTQLQLGSISDVLVANTYDHVSEVHFYLLQNIENLPDRQALERVARAKYMFDAEEAERNQFIEASLKPEVMFTGHATDYLFCSILIRLALAGKNFDAIDRIQQMLSQRGLEVE